MAGDSRTIAAWILLSRVTGFVRLTTLAAVLGPTYFGNLFQASAILPSSLFGLFTGSLLSALLVPPLVRYIDTGDKRGAARFANGVLGLMAVCLLGVAVVAIALAPWLVKLLTIGVHDPVVRAQQLRLGLPLFALLMPQLVLYGIAGTGIAVQQAHGRFALAAAAPAVENIGVTLVLAAAALRFGTNPDLRDIGMSQLFLLGGGTTVAVGLHAAVQWWGAYRSGITLIPANGWSEPDIQAVFRRGVSSIGYTGQYWIAWLALVVAVGSVAGGVGTLQIAGAVCQVCVALTATPLATAQLPRLARAHECGQLEEFSETYRTSARLVVFTTLPVTILIVAVSHTLAAAMAFGEMAGPAGVALITAALAGLGPGVLGEAIFVLSTSAAYARHDTGMPLRAMAIRLAVVAVGVAIAPHVADGAGLVLAFGGVLAGANLIAGGYAHWGQIARLPAREAGSSSSAAAGVAIAAASSLPAVLAAEWAGAAAHGEVQCSATALLALAAGAGSYLVLQAARGSQELSLLLPGYARWSAAALPWLRWSRDARRAPLDTPRGGG
jgi:putative peptidoglycan lipid II flippase